MESAQLLDILGNENRRKILHLLASRPCYMSEIAERLDVGAKAILGHLELLVQAGMVEANVDEQRRKYFHITDNLRLEVFVSPYSFDVEITTLALSAPREHAPAAQDVIKGLKSHYGQIRELLDKRHNVMQEYQHIQGNITEAMGHCMDAIEDVAQDNIEAEILYALIKSPMNARVLSMQLGIPEYVIEGYIEEMEHRKILKRDENNYIIG
ncbi:MAG TPA: ArsR family transcriptional regulator [Candidatus Methanoperedens sp.]|nr:ArsR family transcriptional regulator [Candidatus Methanoperedens sp.]